MVSKIKQGKKLLKEFEAMKNFAEIKVLSNASLKRPLTDKEYKRIMELKEKVFVQEETGAWS